MDNKVGNKPLTPELLADLKKRLVSVIDDMKEYGVILSQEERTTLSRPRVGSETYVRQMADVVTKHNLHHPSNPVEGMREDLAVAEAFATLAPLFKEGFQISEDTINQAKSEFWESFLFYNGMIQGIASRLPDVANDAKPFEDFLALGPRKKKPTDK